MGVDFAAILDHQLTWSELYVLPELLKKGWCLPPELAPWVAQHVRTRQKHWTWQRDRRFGNVAEELFEQQQIFLDGPDGFHGTVYKRAVAIGHLARWWSFLHERDAQVGLIKACHDIAVVLRAKHILFLPDNAFPPSEVVDRLCDGASVNDALDWLNSNVGPAFPSPSHYLDDEATEWDERGWFYERAKGR